MYFSHVLTLWQKSLSIYETHRVTPEKSGKLCNSNQDSFDYKSCLFSLTNKVQMHRFTFKGLWTGLNLIFILSFTSIQLMFGGTWFFARNYLRYFHFMCHFSPLPILWYNDIDYFCLFVVAFLHMCLCLYCSHYILLLLLM